MSVCTVVFAEVEVAVYFGHAVARGLCELGARNAVEVRPPRLIVLASFWLLGNCTLLEIVACVRAYFDGFVICTI